MFSHVWLFVTLREPARLLCPWNFFQARILEWVAISSSRKSSQPSVWTHILCLLHCRWIHQEILLLLQYHNIVIQSILEISAHRASFSSPEFVGVTHLPMPRGTGSFTTVHFQSAPVFQAGSSMSKVRIYFSTSGYREHSHFFLFRTLAMQRSQEKVSIPKKQMTQGLGHWFVYFCVFCQTGLIWIQTFLWFMTYGASLPPCNISTSWRASLLDVPFLSRPVKA